jgi:hypothetical protein
MEMAAPHNGIWRTAVFRRRFGFFGLSRPALLLGGADDESLARRQHELVGTLIRNADPSEWEAAKGKLTAEMSLWARFKETWSEDRQFTLDMLRQLGEDIPKDIGDDPERKYLGD